jgi:Mce-associated membrane protein
MDAAIGGFLRALAIAVPATLAAIIPGQPAAADQSAPDAARAAACSFGRALATYDYAHFDSYAQHILQGSTGLFRLVFSDNSEEIRNDLTSVHAVSRATDADCAIRTGDGNRAEVGVAIDSVITLDATKGRPRPNRVTVILTVDNVAGHWLTSSIDTPGADSSDRTR